MEPTNAAQILQQSDELQKLTKELDKCRADKEFVWGLWKKLQKTNPDLNAAIEMVVTREKSCHQQKLDQLLAYGQEKETHCNKLSEESQQLSRRLEGESEKLKLAQSENHQLCDELSALQTGMSTASQRIASCEEIVRENSRLKETNRSMETELEVLQQQLSTQELAFKKQVTEMSDKIRTLVAENKSLSNQAVQAENRGRDMQEQLREFGEQLRAVRDECNQRVEATRDLDLLLEQKERNLEMARRDNEEISRRFSECVAEGERHKLCAANETRSLTNRLQSDLKETEEQLTHANSLNQMLSNKVAEEACEISHLKEHMRELESFRANITQLQRTEAYTQTDILSQAVDSTTVVVQLLESKSLETNQLRKSHDRRLQRYKELQANNKLLRDQLSTYSPDSIPSIQQQREEGERVLNKVPTEPPTAHSCDSYIEVSE